MTIEKYIGRPFNLHGETMCIKESGGCDEGFYLAKHPHGYLANVRTHNDKFISWYTFFLGKEVKGKIQFSEIETNLID